MNVAPNPNKEVFYGRDRYGFPISKTDPIIVRYKNAINVAGCDGKFFVSPKVVENKSSIKAPTSIPKAFILAG